MECVNFKKRISKKTSGKLLLEKLKIIKVVYARYMCKKIIEFLTRDIFIRKLFRFNLDIIIETEDKNFPSANKN